MLNLINKYLLYNTYVANINIVTYNLSIHIKRICQSILNWISFYSICREKLLKILKSMREMLTLKSNYLGKTKGSPHAAHLRTHGQYIPICVIYTHV